MYPEGISYNSLKVTLCSDHYHVRVAVKFSIYCHIKAHVCRPQSISDFRFKLQRLGLLNLSCCFRFILL